MDLYIDKENLFSFFTRREEEDYADCIRLIRRHLHLIFGFEETEVGEWNEYNKLCFLKEFSEGRGWKEERDSYKIDFLKTN